MTKVTFIEFNGQEHVVSATPGHSLMETAKKNNVPGIDADCGGNCSCGTCHVFVDPEWVSRLAPRAQIEISTMEFVEDTKPNSRLSCQIKVTEALDGLVVRLPASQR